MQNKENLEILIHHPWHDGMVKNKQTHVTVPLSKISCCVWKVETTSMSFLHGSKARREAVQMVQAALEICTVEIRIRYGIKNLSNMHSAFLMLPVLWSRYARLREASAWQKQRPFIKTYLKLVMHEKYTCEKYNHYTTIKLSYPNQGVHFLVAPYLVRDCPFKFGTLK